jgi:hypothetical protein
VAASNAPWTVDTNAAERTSATTGETPVMLCKSSQHEALSTRGVLLVNRDVQRPRATGLEPAMFTLEKKSAIIK